jgi:hypothetical protein
MSQPFQQIGQCSPALDAVAQERQGWGASPPLAGPGLPGTSDPPEDLGYEYTDADDFSFRDRRAATQKLAFAQGLGTELQPPRPMAAHTEIPMTARTVIPPALRRGPEDGLDSGMFTDASQQAGAQAPYPPSQPVDGIPNSLA